MSSVDPSPVAVSRILPEENVDGATADGSVEEHPVVRHLSRSMPLREAARRGLFAHTATKLVLHVLTIGSIAVLARLLSPADYGLMALTAVFMGFATILTDMGLGAAVVQARRIDDRLLSTAFWLNAVLCLAVAAVVAALAWPISWFFGEPQLVGLTLVASLSMLISVNTVNVGLMRRSLRFDIEGTITIVSSVVTIVATIALALAGAGAYSLVVGPLAGGVTTLVCTFCTVRWSPGWCFDRTAARTLWGFSRGLTGFTIINYWSRNADRVIIGKLIDVTSLGYYNRANQLATLPTSQGVSTLGRVFFPVLSRMADDVPRMARAWLMLVRLSFLVGLPMGIGLAIAADSLVVVFLGPAWQPVVPLLEVMSATIPFLLVGVNMSPVYQAVGRTDQLFRTGLITSILTIVFMLTGSYWGVLGIVLAGLIRCPITLGINAAPVLKMLRLRWRDVLAPLWRSAVPGAAMAAALVVVEAVLVAEAPPVTLSVQVAVGCLVYGSGAWFLNRALVREALRGRAG